MASRVAIAFLLCTACSPADTAGRPRAGSTPPAVGTCSSAETRACTCDDGASGLQRCTDTWSDCVCSGSPVDFGNAMPNPSAGHAGAAAPVSSEPDAECRPGLYRGTYHCELDLFGIPAPLEGPVSFTLRVDERVTQVACDDEFCTDLVISENGGTLFGLAGLWGFETMLEGALDCRTGEFRARGLQGKWGFAESTDASDPDAPWMVADPPQGAFSGELTGTHTRGAVPAIEGNWILRETGAGLSCTGPFRVELQP